MCFQNLKNKIYVKKIKKAADNGDNQARYDYAMILINGELVKKNTLVAMKYLKLAADEGHTASLIYLKANNLIQSVKNITKTLSDISKNTKFE